MKKIILLLLLMANFISNEIKADELVEVMREKIGQLGAGNSFLYMDLALTDEEIESIDKIKFDNLAPLEDQRQYSRFGNLHLIKEELPTFLREIGNDDEEVIQAVTDIISRTADQVTKASGKNSAWVAVRAFTSTHEYDTPRWHIDGHYYGPIPYPGIVFKFAAVLKGNPTLLYKIPDEMRETFFSNWNDRKFLSELLDINKAESPKKGEGVFFVVDDMGISAVHSEPKIEENRLFFSILIGDESEINELYTRWHRNKK